MTVSERLHNIGNALKSAYDFVTGMGYTVWVVNLYGSQNYDLDTPESDYDFKAVVLPSIDEVVNNTTPVSKVYDFAGGQVDVKDVRLMFNNYAKQNPNFMETLFTRFYTVNPLFVREWEEVRALADRVAYADPVRALNAMVGMAMEKCHALCHPYEGKLAVLAEHGYDSKQLSHEYRLWQMMQKFARHEDYATLLVSSDEEREFLMNLKLYKPQLSVEEAKRQAADCVAKMSEFKQKLFDENDYTVDTEAYDHLNEVKAKAMKRVFLRELTNS